MLKLALLCLSMLVLCQANHLDANTFQTAIATQPTFVKFYAPWCGHCKRLVEPWAQLTEAHDGKGVTIAKVDCTVETALCSEHGIRGYPTLKFFKDGSSEAYSGARSVEAFSQFIQTRIGGQAPTPEVEAPAAPAPAPAPVPASQRGLYIATDATFSKIIESGLAFVKFYAPWCGHCKTLAPVIDQVAEAYEQSKYVKIVKVDCTVESVCDQYQVKGYPTLVLFKEGKEVERYNGGRTVMAITEYLQRHIATAVAAEKPVEVIEVVNGLRILTDATFDLGIASGYTFIKCGHCKNLAPIWEALASSSTSGVAVAKVDCTLYSKTCDKFNIKGYPTLLLFKNGAKVAEYRGGRDAASFATYLADAAQGKRDEL